MDKLTTFILIFNFLWIVCLSISRLNINKFYIVDDYTYFIIIVGIISLNFGFVISKFVKLKPSNLTLNENKIKYIKIINRIYFLVNVVLAFKILNLLKVLPYAAIRHYQFPKFGEKEIIYGSKYLRIIYSIFGEFSNYILIIIFIYLYFNDKKNKKLQIIIILNIFLNSFITGSRIILGNLIFITCMYLLNYRKNLNRKIPIFKIITLVLIMNIMSNYRSWNVKNKASIFETISIYYQGAINMLDYFLVNFDKYEIYYGRLNLSVIDFPISMFFKKVCGFKIKSAYESFNFINSFYINIGGIKYNALYTIFQSFYADYKEVGIIFYGIIYGVLIGIFIKKYEKSIWSGVVISYLQVLMLQSTLKNNLIGNTVIFVLLVWYSLSKKIKNE